MSDYGVTAEGFNRPTMAEIIAELEEAFKAKFGDGVNLSSSSPLGNLVGIMSEREDLIWQKVEDWYNQLDPDKAEGELQDRLYRLNDQTRKPASYSTVPVIVTGDPGTVVDGPPNPFSGNVSGDSTAVFAADEEAIIPESGSVEVQMTATEVGPIPAIAGTLTVIKTPKAGITGITNQEDAIEGQLTETATKFRQRRLRNLRRAGSATLKGIIARVDNVAGVTLVGGSENKSNQTDENGLPPKSVEVHVSGGNEDAIAEAIASAVSGGIETHGDISVDVEDTEGNLQTMKFSRPTGVPIYIIATVLPNQDAAEGEVFPADGDARLTEAIADYGSEIAYLGQNVAPFQLAKGAAAKVPGIYNLTLKIGRTANPTSGDVLVIAPNELPQFDASRVTVERA